MRARIARLGLLGAVVGALILALVATPAAADPTYPSQRQVDAAKAKVASTAATVGRLEAQLVAADARLEELAVQAAQAVEAYDGARWALQEATAAAEDATARFGVAQGQVHAAEDALGAYASAVYRSGGDLAAVGSLLDAAGPAQLAHRMSMLARLGDAQQQVVEALQVSRAVAAGLSVQAEAARTRQEQAVERVAAAKAAAQARVAEQKRSVATIQTQRAELVAALAKARRTSVALEQARAEGIAKERAERARRAEQARRAAAAARAAEAAAAARAAGGGSGTGVAPAPAAAASGGTSYGTAAGAATAISYARAQLGKPYVWAAAGPDTFDCSGLTMRAWQAGGVSLPHYSVAQWDRVKTVDLSDLRAGDLVFFATSKTNPATIYHVGLYIGGGQMIEAPYTGENVRISSIYRASLFGAGRP